VRLASQLTGWDIDIVTEDEESERRQKEFAERTQLFMGALDVDEMVAQLLASEGFASVEEVAFVGADELASIEGFDEETAAELQLRAREHLEKIEAEQDEERRKLGVADDLKDVPGVTSAMLVALGKADIKTLEDLAYCAVDDLIGWSERKDGETTRFEGALTGMEISRQEAEEIVMAARIKAGLITEADLDAGEAPAQAEPAAV
jgi:N utilization substance protein A